MNIPGHPAPGRRRLGGWLPHVALLGLAALLVVSARARHMSDEVAWRIARDESAPSQARIEAIHRLANRAEARDPRIGDELARALLASPDERLREFALTGAICKHHDTAALGEPPKLQASYALGFPGAPGSPHHVRSLLVYLRKVGGPPVGGLDRLSWEEVRWFTDSLAGRPLPAFEVLVERLRARRGEGEEASRRLKEMDR